MKIKPGDFSLLSADYMKYRPSYSEFIVDLMFGALNKQPSEVVCADIGAGTGIFTKLILNKKPKELFAVEPNENMLLAGKEFLPNGVKWTAAFAESTGLPSNSIDLITMASSFHWTNSKLALHEFNRVLTPSGIFVALWNPRITELSKIESLIDDILTNEYSVKSRVSSGRSGITTDLTSILKNSNFFSDVSYIEIINKVYVSPKRYIGAWRSVNDIRSQLGEENFKKFITQVSNIVSNLEHIEVHYMTRAWISKVK